MSAVGDQALQNNTEGQSVVFHIKKYVKVAMSPSSGGRNCSLAWNVLFPISKLQMSEKIYVAQQRHASNFYLYFLETWFSLELSRPFSINAVPSLFWPSWVGAEELRLGSLPLLFSVPERIWERTLFTRLTLGCWLWFQKVPNNAKCSQMLGL